MADSYCGKITVQFRAGDDDQATKVLDYLAKLLVGHGYVERVRVEPVKMAVLPSATPPSYPERRTP